VKVSPLEGLHVVECASFVAGPTGGMTLAQLGADVVPEVASSSWHWPPHRARTGAC
jgi:crotonobetainyl-CoA:carnitine CoA-transferase CaiB-like acyl-CoA transferase